MKKCPFCKADIEENAQFCLYCMKPLMKKTIIAPPKKRRLLWPVILAILLFLGLMAVILLLPGNVPAAPGIENPSVNQPVSAPEQGGTQSPVPEDTAPENLPVSSNPQPSDPTIPVNTPPENTPPENTPPENTPPVNTPPDTPPVITPPPSADPEQTDPELTEPKQPQPEPTPTEPEETEPPKSQAVYAYRAAQAGDDFSAHYQNTGNDIVITGITQPSADGIYDIPAYIDGKKVIAIVANAFSHSNATTVYVPATVKNIQNYAFAACNLQDIYFRGSAIYTAGMAFSSSVTIHCSASCSDRNLRYYKNSAVNYGAVWEEWNG